MHGGSSHSAIGSISSIGHTNKLGQASLSSGNPFTTGFSVGFKAGTRISAIGTVEQNNLDAVATMIANGVVEKVGLSSITTSVTTKFSSAIEAKLQSTASLAGNSVLLHGGSIVLSSVARIQPKLSTEYDNPDIIPFTVYIFKSSPVDAYIRKTMSLDSYVDKQFLIDASIDKSSSKTSYIDKILEKTLVRER